MARKHRSDSVTSAAEAFRKTGASFVWPVDTVSKMADAAKQEHAQRIADQIYQSRAEADWRPFDATQIAQLAIVTVDLDILQTMISQTGYVTRKEGSKGQQVLARNPLLDPIVQLQNRQITLARSLALTGAQTDSRSVANAAKTQAKAQGTIDAMDDLLARPN
mgnify:CR=1 FL=1